MSQLDLTLDCDVSALHLSFLETGQAKPSRETVLQIADGLILALASRNALLQAAGPFRAVLQEMMDRPAPYPAILADRHWRVRATNTSTALLLAPPQGEANETSLIRMLTDSPAAEAVIENLPAAVREMRGRIAPEALEAGNGPVLRDLLEALEAASLRHPVARPSR
ncbi:MAG: hypothetical protein WEA77_06425 [Hyphomonas sp.]|uniref:MmyB family transcriptional regulator n=1 Tax=Hyphomonas sp. TaxID=87 RepID=UPI0034A0A713